MVLAMLGSPHCMKCVVRLHSSTSATSSWSSRPGRGAVSRVTQASTTSPS